MAVKLLQGKARACPHNQAAHSAQRSAAQRAHHSVQRTQQEALEINLVFGVARLLGAVLQQLQRDVRDVVTCARAATKRKQGRGVAGTA